MTVLPLDALLALADAKGTASASAIIGEIDARVARGEKAEPWIRAVRIAADLSVFDDDEVCFLIFKVTEDAVGNIVESDPVLSAVMEELAEIRASHGLEEDEDWHVGEGPAEWAAANARFDARFRELQIQLCTQSGETQMARAFALRPDAVDESCSMGWSSLMPTSSAS